MINFAENLNKMIDAGLGGPLDPPRTEVAVGHRVVYTEASGAVDSFETNVVAPLKNLRVSMEPIQAGSGDPSPENIRPITGRESVTVTRTGKNLISPTIVSGLLYNKSSGTFTIESTDRAWTQADGKLTYTTSANYTNLSISTGLLPAGKYHVKLTKLSPGTLRSTRYVLDSEGNVLAKAADSNITNADTPVTLTEPGYYAIFLDNGSTANQTVEMTVQIEVGSTASDYEPYTADSATIQLGQTVYGGTVDVSSGRCHSLWANIPAYAGEDLPGEWLSDRDVYEPGTVPTIGAQVVYKREVADMIILTPVQLNTLAGENNVWSDAGDVALEYPYYEETEGY